MARDETQAMSTERLAEIRKRADDPRNYYYSDGTDEDYLIERELLAEVERQRAALDAKEAREAALLAVVEKVWTLAVQSTYDGKWFIPHVHAAHILIEQARALLASAGEADGEQAAQSESDANDH